MFIGIDLGTSNSTLAAFDGQQVRVVPNTLGENLTPSVVRMDAKGEALVGRRALRFQDTDPGNVAREWKRLMGTAETVRFPGANLSLLPEELSAWVLRSLLADAKDALGFAARAAVISTPALFELPQNHATAKAGTLAGLEEVVLLQEPIAAAVAAGWRRGEGGTWIVFDLGGGTLDVSLLETDGDRLRVVDHAGDNFLGGKDVDNALVDFVLARLGRTHSLPGGAHGDSTVTQSRVRLKAACEQARIELSRAQHTLVIAPSVMLDRDGHPIDIEQPLSRADLHTCLTPFLDRAEGVVRGLLAKNRCAADEVARVVFVGGPTCTPLVRERIGGLFGGRVAEGIDPMTVVAQGAALYAASAGVSARSKAATTTPAPGMAMRIEHPPVTADDEPFVVGRFLPGAGQPVPARVRVVRVNPASSVAPVDIPVSVEGSFVAQATLEKHQQNRFKVEAFAQTGVSIALASPEFSIVHGLSVAEPPLSRSVGIATADDGTQVYFPKGTPLPARRMFVHQTVARVSARGGEPLRIPVVQGESHRAHRNRLIGSLEIDGGGTDLPAGTRVEITLHLDRSGQLFARADVPAIGKSFEDVARVLVPSASFDTVSSHLATLRGRLEEISRRVFQSGLPSALQAISDVPAQMDDAERTLALARSGDRDAVQRAARLVDDASAALDEAEAILMWPELETEAQRYSLLYAGLVAQWGTSAEQGLFDHVLQAATRARAARDTVDLERQLQAMHAVGKAAYCRNPHSVQSELDWLSSRVSESVDVPRAHQIIEKARKAVRDGEIFTARALLSEAWVLFPGSEETRELSFGSGVR